MGQKDYNNADVETQPHAEQKNLKDFFFFMFPNANFSPSGRKSLLQSTRCHANNVSLVDITSTFVIE